LIGYGNTLRRDDGVGILAAEITANSAPAGVRSMTRHQLVPELAETISRAHAVVFIDADPDARAAELHPVEPATSSEILAHAPNPRTLLALSHQLFGHLPKAWTLGIPVEDLDFGEGLSARAKAGLDAALKLLKSFIRESLQQNNIC
jgi:hydrogenase maturation protease